jgi:hypothetical protein
MLIIDLIQIPDTAPTPHRGTVIFVSGSDPDLIDVGVGTHLKQGENTWEVTAIEAQRRIVGSISPPVPGQVGLLLSPQTPMPTRGEIQKVSP